MWEWRFRLLNPTSSTESAPQPFFPFIKFLTVFFADLLTCGPKHQGISNHRASDFLRYSASTAFRTRALNSRGRSISGTNCFLPSFSTARRGRLAHGGPTDF